MIFSNLPKIRDKPHGNFLRSLPDVPSISRRLCAQKFARKTSLTDWLHSTNALINPLRFVVMVGICNADGTCQLGTSGEYVTRFYLGNNLVKSHGLH